MRSSRHRDHSHQLDLFLLPQNVPDWRSLPTEVREQIKLLLARMLGSGPVESGEAPARETGDE